MGIDIFLSYGILKQVGEKMRELDRLFKEIRNPQFTVSSLKNSELVNKEISRLEELYNQINNIPEYVKLREDVVNEEANYKKLLRNLQEYRRVERIIANRIAAISSASGASLSKSDPLIVKPNSTDEDRITEYYKKYGKFPSLSHSGEEWGK